MAHLHQHIRRAAAILAGLTGLAAVVVPGPTPALAGIRVPGPGGDPSGAPPLIPAVTRTVAVGGMP